MSFDLLGIDKQRMESLAESLDCQYHHYKLKVAYDVDLPLLFLYEGYSKDL